MSAAEVDPKAELYARDLTGVTWVSAPGSDPSDRFEAAFLDDGAVAVRDPADPGGKILRYDAQEWAAFLAGAKDGEFDQ